MKPKVGEEFDEATTVLANELGIDPDLVIVKGDVAEFAIELTESVNPSKLSTVSNAFKEQKINSLRIIRGF